ncbi:MAG: glycosyltransferase [Victivallaceae bacterium]|nr:glycosyltransferase [Victivallaceae bacterium]
MKKRRKIFISAYACEPEKGSEPGIGWNVVNQLARSFEVHVLTRANNREGIEKALAGKTENVPVFHYYDLPEYLSFWKKKRRGYHLYYYLWQFGAYFRYRNFVNASGFDIVQHLTFANFATPSLFMLAKPFTVWGPVGRTSTPRAIFSALPFKVKVKEFFRAAAMTLMCRLDIFRILTERRADLILESGFPPGKSGFPARLRNKIIAHTQTGIETREPEYDTTRRRAADGRVRFLICSEFLHWKGVTFAAELFCRVAAKRRNAELFIYGNGPEEAAMKKIFSRHGMNDRVFFKGFVGKAEMIQALFDADVLLYLSYHHGLATVVLQAMYAKLPILALAGDPVGETVAQGAGIAAGGKTMAERMDKLEDAALKFADFPDLRRQYGERGRELIETNYEWNVLCRKLAEKLESVL